MIFFLQDSWKDIRNLKDNRIGPTSCSTVTPCWGRLCVPLRLELHTRVWFGVHTEQQLNALEMAVEICIDWTLCIFQGEAKIIESKTVEAKIRELLKDVSDVRKKVTEIKRKSREKMAENGSSYNTLGRLIEGIIVS